MPAISELTHRRTILALDDLLDNLSLKAGLLKDRYEARPPICGEKPLAMVAMDAQPELILPDIINSHDSDEALASNDAAPSISHG